MDIFVTDNATNNDTCLQYLGAEFGFDPQRCRLRCTGHIFNLCQAVLFGKDSDAFERELDDIKLEETYLMQWRRKGPCGKLHNVLYYFDASPQRIEAFNKLQLELIAPFRGEGKLPVYAIVKDVVTRWNSFDATIERALYLRPAIDEFCQQEHDKWLAYVRRIEQQGKQVVKSEPAIIKDTLTDEDWTILAGYHQIHRPLKEATELLQGKAGGRFGAIGMYCLHLNTSFATLRIFESNIQSRNYTSHLIQSFLLHNTISARVLTLAGRSLTSTMDILMKRLST